jgi:hypothetical protein
MLDRLKKMQCDGTRLVMVVCPNINTKTCLCVSLLSILMIDYCRIYRLWSRLEKDNTPTTVPLLTVDDGQQFTQQIPNDISRFWPHTHTYFVHRFSIPFSINESENVHSPSDWSVDHFCLRLNLFFSFPINQGLHIKHLILYSHIISFSDDRISIPICPQWRKNKYVNVDTED